MDLVLQRTNYDQDGIFGKFLDARGKCVCVTLEHAFHALTGAWVAAVPPGTYTCVRRMSPHFGYEVFQLLDVPGHDWIEIHRGNWNSQTQGCILVGDKLGRGLIMNSEVAFDRFMALQNGVDRFVLLVLA